MGAGATAHQMAKSAVELAISAPNVALTLRFLSLKLDFGLFERSTRR